MTTVCVRDVLPNVVLGAPSESDGGTGTVGDETCGFEIGATQIIVPGLCAQGGGAVCVCFVVPLGRGVFCLDMKHLALYEVGDDAGDELGHLAVAEAGKSGAGPAEDEVACEDGEFVAVRSGGGGVAATEGRFVDDVVVEEGSDVDHLDDLGEAYLGWEDGRGGGGAGEFGRGSGCGIGERDEREGLLEGRGMGREERVPVVKDVRAGHGRVEVEKIIDGTGFLRDPFRTEAVGRTGEEQDEEGSELLGRMEEIVPCDVGEKGRGCTEEDGQGVFHLLHFGCEQRRDALSGGGRCRRCERSTVRAGTWSTNSASERRRPNHRGDRRDGRLILARQMIEKYRGSRYSGWCYSVVVITRDFDLDHVFPETQVRTLVAPTFSSVAPSPTHRRRPDQPRPDVRPSSVGAGRMHG